MQGLAETTAFLSRLKRQGAAFSAGGSEAETLLRETSRFGANPGNLRMLSYTPQDLPAGGPLVVVLHGCTQQAEAHAVEGGWLTLADRFGFAVIAPEQSPANSPNRCFNWFEPQDAARGKGEAASIRAMVAHAVREHGLDKDRVFVTGLSAGGAMTSVMLAAYPDVFAAGAIVAGLPYGVAESLPEALGAMFGGRGRGSEELGDLVRRAAPKGGRVPRVSIWHGDADTTVKPYNALEIAHQWAAVHGVGPEPSETQALPGRTRTLWRAQGSDEVLIESNLIAGLGHGTPLATGGADGVGKAAPYMLEAGVSSSLEIARFWGVADAGSARSAPRPRPTRDEPASASRSGGPKPFPAADDRPQAAQSLSDQVMASLAQHVPANIQSVIAKALKSAGL